MTDKTLAGSLGLSVPRYDLAKWVALATDALSCESSVAGACRMGSVAAEIIASKANQASISAGHPAFGKLFIFQIGVFSFNYLPIFFCVAITQVT